MPLIEEAGRQVVVIGRLELRIRAQDPNPDCLTFWGGHDHINKGYVWAFPKVKSGVINLGSGELILTTSFGAKVGFVATIQEIDHDNVVLLAVAMATANALLDALRVPGKVIVHDHGAELQVDAFCGRFRGDHDLPLFLEIVHSG